MNKINKSCYRLGLGLGLFATAVLFINNSEAEVIAGTISPKSPGSTYVVTVVASISSDKAQITLNGQPLRNDVKTIISSNALMYTVNTDPQTGIQGEVDFFLSKDGEKPICAFFALPKAVSISTALNNSVSHCSHIGNNIVFKAS